MIYDIHPQKVYMSNINKDATFHLETLDEAKRTMAQQSAMLPYSETFEERGVRTSLKEYTSPQKVFWADSPTYSKEYKNPAFKEIFEFVNKCADEFLKELKVDLTLFQVQMSSAYLNACTDGLSGGGPHNHRGALLSYTYYFHLRGELQPLIFGSPTQQDGYFFPWEMCSGRATVEFWPTAGDILLFPAYLDHRVPDPLSQNDERWLFNGDFHIFSDGQPNLPNRIP